jgi:putative membrane protein
MMHDDWSYRNYDGNGFGNMLFMLILTVLIIIGVVLLVHHFSRVSSIYPYQETALEALRKRYVAGDIDKKEFEEKRKDISM